MEIVFDTKRLYSLLRDFHQIARLRVGVYTLDLEEVAAYPVQHSGFCKLIRGEEQGLSRCKSCDAAAFAQAANTQAVHIYRCHAGLVEAVAPILDRKEVIGYLMIGQMRPEGNPQHQCRQLDQKTAGLMVDGAVLQSAFLSLAVMEEEKIRACAHILQACAVSIWLDDYIRIQGADLAQRLDEHIANHLASPLPLEALCRALSVGKTTLCRSARQRFGVSIGDLVRRRRMETAANLLRLTADPVASIAEQVGIGDYNYFTKVFKSETGLTPTAYRKRYRKTER